MTRSKFSLRAVVLHPAFIAGAFLFLWWAYRWWPLPVHLGSYQPGGPGDGWGGTAIWQALVTERLNPFGPGEIASYNAPNGYPIPWQVNIQQWPTTIFYYGVTRLTGDADIAHNLYMMTGFVGTAASMAWLVWRFVVQDRWIAVLAGVALVWQPLLIVKAAGHTAFAHLWPIVLAVGLVLLVAERPSIKRGIAAGAMAVLAMSWSGYHFIMTVAAFGLVFIGVAVISWKNEERRKVYAALATTALTVAVGVGFMGAALLIAGRGADPTDAVRGHSLDTLTIFGARLHEYFIPPVDSRFFGGMTREYLEARRHGSGPAENSLYIGNSLVLLAIAGVVFLLFRRFRRDVTWLRTGVWTLVVIGPLFALWAFFWSLPPHVYALGIEIPTPSLVAFQFVQTWRVYSRFSLVVAIGVIILAAIGLRWAAGSSSRVRYVAVLGLATIAIPLDLSVGNPVPTQTYAPQIASAIAKLPPGIVAIYPLERGETDGYGQFYNQQAYKHPVLNGFDDRPEEARAQRLADITKQSTVNNLAALGVRYVVLVRRAYAGAPPGTPPLHGEAKSLKKVASGTYGPYPTDIFEVPVPKKPAIFTTPSKNFGALEGSPEAQYAWSNASTSTLDVRSTCATACKGTLKIEMFANGPARTVTMKINGRPVPVTTRGKSSVGTFTATGSPAVVRVPLTLGRHLTIDLATSPGAIPVNQIIPGSPDTRPLSIGVGAVTWEPETP